MTEPDADRDRRTLVLICYLLHIAGAVTGLLSLIGLVINYLKLGATPPELDSHHRWMVRSFWWALLFVGVGLFFWITLILIPVAFALWFLVWLWYLYRHVKGIVALLDHQAMPL